MTQYRAIHWILGDQLNADHNWYSNVDPERLFVIAELRQETDYTRHHVQKVCAFFTAMAEFAHHLTEAGHHVLHLTLDETAGYSDLNQLVLELIERFQSRELVYQRPDEYRLLRQFEELTLPDSVEVLQVDSEHFLLPFQEIQKHFTRGKHQRMETFYRMMRRRFDLLMDGEKPFGGKWNYDGDNRKKLKSKDLDALPVPLVFSNDVRDALSRIREHNVKVFGNETKQLSWPTSRKQALKLLDFFCEHCLQHFGDFQDAMTGESDHAWSLYHSRLSFALNCKMLSPLEVIEKVIATWEENTKTVSLAQVEGFVRQILGWREYIRGVYWANMPGYSSLNYFQAKRELPDYFWTGNTRMHCMQKSIGQSLDYSYAHHIQRLMVIGNFCLLTEIDPNHVDAWYLGIYIDAIEWVELPNTRGMSQFADGGLVATKPYAASGNYINKMSDYCANCHYQVSEKTGAKACPFNSLYWHFMHKHQDELSKNHRTRMVYANWHRMQDSQRDAILQQASTHLSNLGEL